MSFFNISKMTTAKKLVITALMISLGTTLQVIESMFNVFAVPGGKIGLANIVTVIDIFLLGGMNGTVVAILRGFLGAVLYGGISAMPYSVCGAMFSALVMWGGKKAFYPKLGVVGISVIGAFFHNLAQVTVASLIFKSPYLFMYLPVLTIVGTIGGILTGLGAQLFCKKTGLIQK